MLFCLFVVLFSGWVYLVNSVGFVILVSCGFLQCVGLFLVCCIDS